MARGFPGHASHASSPLPRSAYLLICSRRVAESGRQLPAELTAAVSEGCRSANYARYPFIPTTPALAGKLTWSRRQVSWSPWRGVVAPERTPLPPSTLSLYGNTLASFASAYSLAPPVRWTRTLRRLKPWMPQSSPCARIFTDPDARHRCAEEACRKSAGCARGFCSRLVLDASSAPGDTASARGSCSTLRRRR